MKEQSQEALGEDEIEDELDNFFKQGGLDVDEMEKVKVETKVVQSDAEKNAEEKDENVE